MNDAKVKFRELGIGIEILQGFAFSSGHFSEKDGLPLVRIRDLESGITETRYSGPYSDEYVINLGDVLIGMDGDFKVVRWSGERALLNQRVCRVRSCTPAVDDGFLFHAIQPEIERIHRLTPQTTVRHLSSEGIRACTVLDVGLDKQRRIAEILDTVDEAIQATERVIAKHLNIERGLRRDLLDGEFAGARFEDWTQCRIGDFASVQRGASPRPIDNPAWFSPDGPGWIRISDVTAADDVLLRTRDHLSPAGVARSRRVRPGDVIMSIAATIGVAIVVGIEACYHDGFVRIDHDGSVVPEFLVMLLEHHKQDFIRSGQTGTQANINSRIVAATQVSLPSLDIQSEIVTATLAVRGAIRAEKESCRALHAMRAGLADDLLSGRVRTVAA